MKLPAGFRAGSATAGLKASGKPDVALIVNDGSGAGAGVFTTNRVVAHPVTWSRKVADTGTISAIVLNSGNANAATRGGMDVVIASAQAAMTCLGYDMYHVAICSTGVIGEPLDATKLLPGIARAATTMSESLDEASRAIMTTDTVPKMAEWDGHARVVGMAKGAGMIAPGLATMLAVVMTDAKVTSEQCREVLGRVVLDTFDAIDVDGCMSTNDSLFLLSSGRGAEMSTDELERGVREVCASLARQMIGDAEGASHDILIRVTSADSVEAARDVARAIARSNLVKCAIFGNDPNWGRIISAAGTVPASRARFEPTDLQVTINGVQVCREGVDTGRKTEVDMSGREVEIVVDLGAGQCEAHVWTNDLTHDYVHENSAYTT